MFCFFSFLIHVESTFTLPKENAHNFVAKNDCQFEEKPTLKIEEKETR